MKQVLKDENDNVFFTIEYFVDKKLLYATWSGNFLSIENIQEGGGLMLENIKKYHCKSMLNDNRGLTTPWDNANEWVTGVWIPQIIEAGLTSFAHILSEDIFAQVSAQFMRDASEEQEQPLIIQFFDNYEEAEKWVLERGKQSLGKKVEANM